MASSSSSGGACSASSMAMRSSSTSEEDCGQMNNSNNILDERKRKRMVSNRESARRSRMRKQKHLDDLTDQVSQLSKDNHHILTTINLTTQLYLNVEADNSVLRAQMSELATRLQSLNDIIDFINSTNGLLLPNTNNNNNIDQYHHQINDVDHTFMINPWGSYASVNQPIIASADMNIMYS